MSIDLCEHDLPIRACEICREAAALESARAAWGASAAAVRDAGKKLEALEKENAALREEIRELNQMGFTHENAAAQKTALDASEYICACGIRVTPHKCLTDNGF